MSVFRPIKLSIWPYWPQVINIRIVIVIVKSSASGRGNAASIRRRSSIEGSLCVSNDATLDDQSSRGEVAPLIPFPDLCYRCLSVGLFTWQARLAINGPEWRWSGGFSELSQRPTTTNLFARPRRHPTKPPQDHKMYSTGWRTFGNGQVSKDVYSHRALQASVTGRRSTKISTGGQSNLT